MNTKIKALILGLFLLLLNSCVNDNESISVKNNQKRIISTNATSTDILIELGVGEQIISVDKYSDASQLNDNVIVMDFLEPNIEAIVELNADLVFYTNYYGGTTNPFDILQKMGVELIEIPTSTSIDDIYSDILFYGEITGTTEKAEKIVIDMRKEVEEIKEIGEKIKNKKDIYFEVDEFEGRLYSAGNNTYINDIINIVGANNIFSDTEGWITVSEESIVEKNPDIIITSNIYNPDVLDDIKNRVSFVEVSAVKNDDIYTINDNLISKGTHDIVEAIKVMAEIIYKDEYDF